MTGERFVVRETDATSVGVPVCQSVKDFVESRAFRYFLKRFCRQQRIPDEREARLSFLLTSAVNGNPGNYDSLTVFLKDSAVQGAIRRFIGGLDATITPDDIARITDPEVRALFESVFISRDPKALTDVFCRSIDRVLASTTSINATRLPWSEVPRDRDVHMFGDTNGSIESLRNLEHAGIVELRYDAQGKITGLAWRGGSSVAVVVGDIFADRNLDSFALSKAFRILREQARRAWGDVSVLYGNHDEFAVSFLAGLRTGILRDCLKEEQGIGMVEFARFLPGDVSRVALVPDTTEPGMRYASKTTTDALNQLWTHRDDILANMCRDPVGRAILEDLCDMQLAYRVHDVLVVHTNPTQEIIDLILEKGVDGLNREWQSKLRSILIDGDTSVRDDLSTLASVMLATNNRYNFTDSQSAEALRNSGINFIVHGHSYNLRRFTPQVVWGVSISGIDTNAFKYGMPAPGVPQTRSTLSVARDGTIRVGIGNESIAIPDIA